MLRQIDTFHTMLKATKSQLADPVVLEQYNSSDLTIVPYGELIAVLLNPLEYDIQIDDFIIRKSEHNNSQISSYPINSESYIKTYLINEKDNVKCIVYSSIKKPYGNIP